MGFDPIETEIKDDVGSPLPTVITDPITPANQAFVDATGALKVTGGGGGEEHTDGEIVQAGDKGSVMIGSDGTNYRFLSVDSNGNLQVDIVSGGTGSEQHEDGETVQVGDKGTVILGSDGTDYQFLKVDANGELQIDVLTLPAIPTGDNTIGRVKITDGITIAQICDHTQALLTSTDSLRSIHEGDHYYIKGWQNVSGAGTTLEFIFSVADTAAWPHALWSISSESEFTFEMYEGATTSSDGTPVPVFNNNRNSTNTSGVGAFSAPTVTNVGTLVYSGKIGSGKQIGGESPDVSLFMGKQNTKYLFRLTHDTVGTHWLDYHFYWYERTN